MKRKGSSANAIARQPKIAPKPDAFKAISAISKKEKKISFHSIEKAIIDTGKFRYDNGTNIGIEGLSHISSGLLRNFSFEFKNKVLLPAVIDSL